MKLLLTYGDGVSDLNINELVSFHKSQQIKHNEHSDSGRFGNIEMMMGV
jgi:NDP-sugar pyrophosphorylase family protein